MLNNEVLKKLYPTRNSLRFNSSFSPGQIVIDKLHLAPYFLKLQLQMFKEY